MKYIHSRILPLLLFIMIYGCFEIVEFNNHSSKGIYAVNCLLEADSTVLCFVTETKYNNGTIQNKFVSNAQVILKSNSSTDTLLYNPEVSGYQNHHVITENRVYECEVRINEDTILYASTFVPGKPEIDSIFHTYINTGVVDERVVNIVFNDDPDEDNYYKLSLNALQSIENNDILAGETDSLMGISGSYIIDYSGIAEIAVMYDMAEFTDRYLAPNDVFEPEVYAQTGGQILIFSDKSFNGEKCILKVLADYELATDSTAFFQLSAVSPSYYHYYESFALANMVEDDPFAEPVNIYTNISNGKGLFAASASDTCSYNHGY
jgi:hypothetical protein